MKERIWAAEQVRAELWETCENESLTARLADHRQDGRRQTAGLVTLGWTFQ